MDYTEKIILSKSLNKSSKNDNMSLNISLSGNKRLLPDDGIETKLDLYDLYVNERKNSNKFRLIVNINPYCSNVLFNPFTEIVKYDNDGNISLLNFKSVSGLTETIGKKSDFTWNSYDAIRDTQLSSNKCGYTYYCGLDIFNNHILRNTTFKTVNYGSKSKNEIAKYSEVYGIGYSDRFIQGLPYSGNEAKHPYLIEQDFNTIDDYLRDKNGIIVSDIVLSKRTLHVIEARSVEVSIPFHLYQSIDLLTFEESYNDNLVEKNGWFGFFNSSNLGALMLNDEESAPTNIDAVIEETEYDDQDSSIVSFNKVINNMKYGDFVDMYPTRELFSFTPLYNKNKKRYEKNWNYCLTYPSSSITKDFDGGDFPFFEYMEDGTVALKTIAFDEYTVDDDGRNLLTIYSICEHGLKNGDSVNIYKNGDLFFNNAKVVRIIDKYIFQIYKDSYNISNMWIDVDEIFNGDSSVEIEDEKYGTITATIEGKIVNIAYSGTEFFSMITESRRCNIDPDSQDVSFKRVVDDVECEYYVRVFSRLPNFKFADAEINDYNLYENKELDLISYYSNPSSETNNFKSSISNTSFANTAYGDSSTEIVFTDDIDTSFLKDNLGRPLSEIYLTIVKNNKGFREWYCGQLDKTDDIEYSHCFGYISSSFLFNDYYKNVDSKKYIDDVRNICAAYNKGLIYDINNEFYAKDEIVFNSTDKYYGDIACYSPVECDETSLQSVMARFNTVQREITSYYDNIPTYSGRSTVSTDWRVFNSLPEDSGNTNGGVLFHDEIVDDDIVFLTNIEDGIDTIMAAKKMWENFNDHDNSYINLNHSSFHLEENSDEKNKYKFSGMTDLREGYYYKMHYKIPLKTVSSTLNIDNGINYEILTISKSDDDLLIKTINDNDLVLNDKLILYDKIENSFFYLIVSEIKSKNYFRCKVKNENLSEGFKGKIKDIDVYSLNKKNVGTPEYAKIIKDGSCRFYWRSIISNGIEENDSKIYPFTNGAFYINRNINFFLRRQDPQKENLGFIGEESFDYTQKGEKIPQSFYDDQYYSSEEIEVC